MPPTHPPHPRYGGSNQDDASAGEDQVDYHSDSDDNLSECAPPPRANYTPRRTQSMGF